MPDQTAHSNEKYFPTMRTAFTANLAEHEKLVTNVISSLRRGASETRDRPVKTRHKVMFRLTRGVDDRQRRPYNRSDTKCHGRTQRATGKTASQMKKRDSGAATTTS
ncbi:unnamed protein product [Leptosia nina]|uniref:Uncharacterized protein n=1 Tax=Leptosia nina TaxID=320188 RepID=A0AAV1IZW7_9NEOP